MQFKVLSSLLLILTLSINLVQAQSLKGRGSTLIYTRLIKMIDAYQKQHGIQITYWGVGMSGGISELRKGQSDFAALDTPLESKDKLPFPTTQVPLAEENIAVIYNLRGLKQPLRFSRSTIGAIIRGQITCWNDARLQKLNPHLNLPNKTIIVVKRNSRSATNWAMARYLNQTDKSWKITREPQWKPDNSRRGFLDNIERLNSTDGSFSFVELAAAKQYERKGGFLYADVEDNGKFYSPDAVNYPIWTRHFIIWKTKSKNAKQIEKFAKWILTDGHKYSGEKIFRPLPQSYSKKRLPR